MNCGDMPIDGPQSIAQVLRSVDCLSHQATSGAFERLFGVHGALSDALTVALSIYVAVLGIGLLTGRTSLRLSLLTPRALTVGLVLTFATSWAAYQQVVVQLAVEAPDEVARILVGGRGSAVDRYAQRLDGVFALVEEAATAASSVGAGTAARAPSITPGGVLWLAAFLLLLGTAGLHIVARILLAALLALGPVFIVLALFRATRGLFEGWVKAVLLFALVPLLGVLAGGGALTLIAPMAQAIANAGSGVSMRMAAGLLLLACVYLGLMAAALKAATVLTSRWSLGGGADVMSAATAVGVPAAPVPAALAVPLPARAPAAAAGVPHGGGSDDRIRQVVAAGQRSRHDAIGAATSVAVQLRSGTPVLVGGQTAAPASARRRTQGLVVARPARPSTRGGRP